MLLLLFPNHIFGFIEISEELMEVEEKSLAI